MEANEKIKTDLILNLKSRFSRLEEWILLYLNQMKQAATVEEIMQIKREMLLAWLEYLPLRPENCYFCIEHSKDKCTGCRYKDFHGKCTEPDSHYAKIIEARRQLESEVKNYYLDETY